MVDSHFIQANTDGRLHDAREPSVSVLNRGYLYGDAIYEVWRSYDRRVFAWEEHLARLERSAHALHFPALPAPAFWWNELNRTVRAYRDHSGYAEDVYIRLQIARGEGAIGLDPALADQMRYVMLVKPVPVLSGRQLTAGLTLSIARGLRRNAPEALNPAWKTGNYLNNILCLREAIQRGADEVLICNQAGEITEAAVCNVAFVHDGRVVTPPLQAGMLEGITRQLLIDQVARRTGIAVEERTVWPADLGAMRECFLLSSTKDVQPVGRIDEHHFSIGPETIGARLKVAFQDYVAETLAVHPARYV